MDKLLKGNVLTWLYRAVIVVSLVLLVYSFTMPWWQSFGTASTTGSFTLSIYGYGFRHNLGPNMQMQVASEETPMYQTYLAWGYVGLCVVAGIISLLFHKTIRSKMVGAIITGVIGIIHMAYAWAALFIVTKPVVESYNLVFRGVTSGGSYLALGMTFNSDISTGFYIAVLAGLLMLVISVVRIVSIKIEKKELASNG